MVRVTGTTNITAITAAYGGREVTLFFEGILTVTDGGGFPTGLALAGNFVTSANDTLTLMYDDFNGMWVEKSRSVN
jgi:hypothetical protein